MKRPMKRKWPPGEDRRDALIEDATVDAHDEDEQRVGFHAVIEEYVKLPFETDVLGVPVTVQRIDMTDDGDIVAVCRRGATRQSIAILDLPLPDPPPPGAEWIEAYRHWARRT